MRNHRGDDNQIEIIPPPKTTDSKDAPMQVARNIHASMPVPGSMGSIIFTSTAERGWRCAGRYNPPRQFRHLKTTRLLGSGCHTFKRREAVSSFRAEMTRER
mmetsp:Transcript_40722/g.60362  ORF Transcript_40722/g.60362 Transcript_40722/m.60362 type:complete len:102 (+) Transcript_40722:1528-1833(+)